MNKRERDRRAAERQKARQLDAQVLDAPDALVRLAPLIHNRRHWLIARCEPSALAIIRVANFAAVARRAWFLAAFHGPIAGNATTLAVIPKSEVTAKQLAELLSSDPLRVEEEMASGRDVIISCAPEHYQAVKTELKRMFS